MTDATDLADTKRKLSKRLLDESGVSGVGIRGKNLVVYLATDQPAIRRKAQEVARDIGVTVPLVFEISGEFRKQ
jgi:RNA-binding protein YhbY